MKNLRSSTTLCNKKGYIFTIDVLVAVIIFATFITLYAPSMQLQDSKAELYTYASQLSSTLDTSGLLHDAIETNNTAILHSFLSELPTQFCLNVSVYTESSYALEFWNSTSSCVNSEKGEYNSAFFYRTIMVDSSWYILRSEVWMYDGR